MSENPKRFRWLVAADYEDPMSMVLKGMALVDACEARELDITDTIVSEQGVAVEPDLWAIRPLEAAVRDLVDPAVKNKLAICARIYAMRFDVDSYPFNFARMGAIVKKLSGGHLRLCQFMWRCNVEHLRGDPHDYITAVLSREITSAVKHPARTPSAEEDPQMIALAKARQESTRGN